MDSVKHIITGEKMKRQLNNTMVLNITVKQSFSLSENGNNNYLEFFQQKNMQSQA